ncbi:MAG: ribosome biogenesis GTP-binding protein YihA/YsxC [Microthrixaceae bacterium]
MARETPIRLEFTTSAPDVDHLPPSVSEVAFAGRSNVGKSSLINAVANRKDLAQVSRTPGRTRLLNVFTLGEQPMGSDGAVRVVDLPGYGYANVPKHVRATWGPMIENYLLDREPLRMVLVLVDGEVGPTALDLGMLDGASTDPAIHPAAHRLTAQRSKRKAEVASRCELEPRDVLWVSAAKGVNIDQLRSRMRSWLLD